MSNLKLTSDGIAYERAIRASHENAYQTLQGVWSAKVQTLLRDPVFFETLQASGLQSNPSETFTESRRIIVERSPGPSDACVLQGEGATGFQQLAGLLSGMAKTIAKCIESPSFVAGYEDECIPDATATEADRKGRILHSAAGPQLLAIDIPARQDWPEGGVPDLKIRCSYHSKLDNEDKKLLMELETTVSYIAKSSGGKWGESGEMSVAPLMCTVGDDVPTNADNDTNTASIASQDTIATDASLAAGSIATDSVTTGSAEGQSIADSAASQQGAADSAIAPSAGSQETV